MPIGQQEIVNTINALSAVSFALNRINSEEGGDQLLQVVASSSADYVSLPAGSLELQQLEDAVDQINTTISRTLGPIIASQKKLIR